MQFIFTSNAKKTLSKLDRQMVQRIIKKIRTWSDSQDPFKYAVKIESYDLYRFRIGDYRIVASYDKENERFKV